MTTQDALTVWENQFNTLFRNSSDGVIVVDRTGLVQRINPAAAAMLRCVPEDCIGKWPGAVFRKFPTLVDLLRGSDSMLRRVPLQGKRIAVGIGENLEQGRLVLLQDVTERENLDSRREQLIHTIGHDLRNPVSAIYGFAELIAMYGTLNDDQERFRKRIELTAQKLQNLLSPIVDLAWVESGMPMHNVPVELARIIAGAVEELSPEARDKRISIATSTQQPLPPVMGDPLRLRQVIFQLVHNAIQYSDPEQPVAIHAFEHEGQVRCSVADRGIGIAEDDLDQIFHRMFRADNERVRSVPGGGIGLTLAQVIIQRHGGTIEVTSTPGRGSTFIFSLPLAS